MKLKGLMEYVTYDKVQGDLEVNIKDIQHDSRKVTEGSLFVCLTGYEADGHNYVEEAIERGAAAIITTRDVIIDNKEIPVVSVKDSREALAQVATKYYNEPTSQFELVGVAGTNGKTSTVFLIDAILRRVKKKTGLIGAVENRIGEEILEAYHTTPDALELQHIFAKMVKANVNDVVMEVSSRAVELKRVEGTEFDAAVFTNLTLEYVGDYIKEEAYRDTKLELFKLADRIVINIDDAAGSYIIGHTQPKELITYSLKDRTADLYADNLDINGEATTFTLHYQDVKKTIHLKSSEIFDIYNALAAMGAVLALNVDLDKAKEALEEFDMKEQPMDRLESKEFGGEETTD